MLSTERRSSSLGTLGHQVFDDLVVAVHTRLLQGSGAAIVLLIEVRPRPHQHRHNFYMPLQQQRRVMTPPKTLRIAQVLKTRGP